MSTPASRPAEGLRRLLAPVVEAHGYVGDDAARTLDRLVAALSASVDVQDSCSQAPGQRDPEVEILACLLAAAVRAHDLMSSDQLHAALSLSETIARLLRVAEEHRPHLAAGAVVGASRPGT